MVQSEVQRGSVRRTFTFLFLTVCLVLISGGLALSEDATDSSADKSGTNPINFTFDARIYNDFQWMNVPGNGHQNVTTFEFRAPFADGNWQFRTRLRSTHVNRYAAGISEYGIGDMDFRLMTVPYVNFEKRFAIAMGLETFLPTGSHDALSSNSLSFGPQAFLGIFGAFGGFIDVFAPGYQHQFSVWEENGAGKIHQSNIDFYFVKTFNQQQQWVLFDPQVILDYENDRQFMIVDSEFGTMLDEFLGTEGHSAWIRPSFGIGRDRPQDFAVEIGYKVIW